MKKEDELEESIEDVSHFIKMTRTFLASDTCWLDIQRRRKGEDPLDPNSTNNAMLDLNFSSEDIKNEILSLSTSDYVKTVKDKEREKNNTIEFLQKK